MEQKEEVLEEVSVVKAPMGKSRDPALLKIKVCFAINRELYREFRQACIQLGTTVCSELERSIDAKVRRWKSPFCGTGSREVTGKEPNITTESDD